MRRLHVVFNPVAGRRRHARLIRTLALLGEACHRVTTEATRGPGHAEDIAASLSREDCDALLVAGGDGTVNEVLNGLRVADLPLAIYPLGTANVLAAEIGMPATPTAFVRALAAATVQDAWLGEAATRRFALMASAGFDARVVAAVAARGKRWLGRAAYLAAAAHLLARHNPSLYHVTIDGTPHEAGGVVVAKGRYYGGRMSVAPEARITDPRLHVCLLHGNRRRDLIGYGIDLARGALHTRPDVQIIPAREVTIASPHGDPLQLDGDVRLHLPATVRLAAAPVSLLMA